MSATAVPGASKLLGAPLVSVDLAFVVAYGLAEQPPLLLLPVALQALGPDGSLLAYTTKRHLTQDIVLGLMAWLWFRG